MRSASTALDSVRRRIGSELPVLILGALAVYAANPFGVLLRAVDDCYWARRGVEIARTPGLFNLRWQGGMDWEYAPLQCWLLGRSFAIFGENDLAARLPTILFAIGTLLIVHRIGSLLLGRAAAATAVAWLAISPYFLDNARGCMMEIPLTFWVSLAFLIFLEGLRRPRLHLLMALPLGAALMTKSVMGLQPLGVFAVAALLARDLRKPWTHPCLWAGVLMGLALGASWFVAQVFLVGAWTLQAHLMAYVGTRAMKPLGLLQHLFGYPIFLMERFQPLILPALFGMVLIGRRAGRERDARLWLLLAWIIVPIVVLSLAGTQARRWLFPLFPPLALCAGAALESLAPRVAWWFRRVVAPAALAAVAVWFWVSPPSFLYPSDREFVNDRAFLQARIPREELLTYLGPELGYWPLANPLLYYDERVLEHPAPTADEALRRALGRSSRLLLCERALLPALTALAPAASIAVEARDWLVLDLAHVPPPLPGGRAALTRICSPKSDPPLPTENPPMPITIAIPRPAADEYFAYYDAYIRLVPGDDALPALETHFERWLPSLRRISEAQGLHRYAAGKWSVKEVLGHVCDGERVFCYRALRFARADETPLPGFEENEWVPASAADRRPIGEIVDELAAVRAATLALFRSFDATMLGRRGKANDQTITPRALAWMIAGHAMHHGTGLRERYGIAG